MSTNVICDQLSALRGAVTEAKLKIWTGLSVHILR